ncbi:MAG: hypothetical protein U1A27_09220 [Phycisphaerae bacterium]
MSSKAADYARQIRQLYQTLLRRHGKPKLHPARDATDELIHAVLCRCSTDARAWSALGSLRRATVDLNDLRVTPVSALAELLGPDFPNATMVAQQVSRVLNSVFARRFTLDLSFIKSMSRRDAERFLNGLSGIDPHDVALFMARFFKMHCVPIDPRGYQLLRRSGLIDPSWSHAETQLFLRRVLPAASGRPFYHLLKRHAASTPLPEPPPPAPAPAPAPAVSAANGGEPAAERAARPGKAGPAAAPRPAAAASARNRRRSALHRTRRRMAGRRPAPAREKARAVRGATPRAPFRQAPRCAAALGGEERKRNGMSRAVFGRPLSSLLRLAWSRVRIGLLVGLLLTRAAAADDPPDGAPAIAHPERVRVTLDAINTGRITPEIATQPASESQPADAAPLPAAARRYFEDGQDRFAEHLWGEAINELARAVQAAPEYLPARLLLARAALLQGNLALAGTHLREAERQRPGALAVQQLLGDRAWQMHQPVAVIAHLRAALACDAADDDAPRVALCRLMLGLTLCDEGYLAAGVEQLRGYLDQVERTPQLLSYYELGQLARLERSRIILSLGAACAALGDAEAAAEAYRRGLAANPRDIEVSRKLAHALVAAGHRDAAREIAERLCGSDETAAAGLELSLAVAPDEAARLETLRRLCGQAGKSQSVKFLRALAAKLRDEQSLATEAGEVTRRIVSLAPASVEDRLRVAELCVREGRDEELVSTLAAAVRGGQEVTGAVVALLERAAAEPARRGRLLDAARKLAGEQATTRPPVASDAGPLLMVGLLQKISGNGDAAAEAFARATDADPKLGAAHAALAELKANKGMWEDAAASCQRAIAAGVRDSADLYRVYGDVLDARDEPGSAEEAYKAATRLNSKDARPWLALVRLYQRRRDVNNTLQALTQVVESVAPDNDEARESLIRELLTTGQAGKAQEQLAAFEKRGGAPQRIARARAFVAYVTDSGIDLEARRRKFRAALADVWKHYPRDVDTAIILASNYWATREYDAGLKYADAALAVDSGSIPAREIRDLLLAGRLEFAESVRVLQSLLHDRPRNSTWLVRLAERSYDAEDFALCSETCQKLLLRSEKNDERSEALQRGVAEWRIAALRASGDADGAIAAAKEWMDRDGNDVGRRSAYLAELNHAGRSDEALARAREWFEHDPDNPTVRMQLVQQLLDGGRQVEAQRRTLEWLSRKPEDPYLLYGVISVLRLARQWDSVAELARSADLGGTALADVFEGLVWSAYVRARRTEEAARYLRDLPERRGARVHDLDLLDVLIAGRRWAEAEQQADQIIQPLMRQIAAGREVDRRPLLEAQRRLSTIYQSTGRTPRAADTLEQALALLPIESEAYVGLANDLGYLYADGGLRLDRAELLTRQAVASEPRRAAYLDSLGWALYKKGDTAGALRFLRRAVRQLDEVEDAVIREHFGDALYRSGDSAAAVEQWQKALHALSVSMALPTVEEDSVEARCRRKLANPQQRASQVAAQAGTASRPASAAGDE